MGKSSVQDFLKGYDRYAKGVSLAYKRKGSYETSIGGICSIFSFVVLIYFFAGFLYDTVAPPGSFSTSEKTELTKINDDGLYETMDVTQQQLFTAYKIN